MGRIVVTQWCRPSREFASPACLGIVQLFGGSGSFVVSRVPPQVPAGVCVALGGVSNACSFVCAPAWAHVVGQATGRCLLGAVQLAGVACVAKKNGEASIMAHVLRIFIRHVGLWWSGKCMYRIAHVVR